MRRSDWSGHVTVDKSGEQMLTLRDHLSGLSTIAKLAVKGEGASLKCSIAPAQPLEAPFRIENRYLLSDTCCLCSQFLDAVVSASCVYDDVRFCQKGALKWETLHPLAVCRCLSSECALRTHFVTSCITDGDVCA